MHRVGGTRGMSDPWIRGWITALMAAGCLHASGAFGQVYKCTDAEGRTAYADRPCAAPAAAGTRAFRPTEGVKQGPLRTGKPAPAGTSADPISTLCAQHEGSQATEAMIQSLPELQRQAVTAALRGVIAGMARDPGAQAALKRVTLHLEPDRNAVICVPLQRAQSPGTGFVAHRIEPNGRMETLQAGAPPQVYNDANEPQTVAARCAASITSCVRSKPAGPTLDECFDRQPVCPAGRLDPAETCCPQACKDAYRRERARGTDATTATLKVIFGDDAGAASCVPGMPRRG